LGGEGEKIKGQYEKKLYTIVWTLIGTVETVWENYKLNMFVMTIFKKYQENKLKNKITFEVVIAFLKSEQFKDKFT